MNAASQYIRAVLLCLSSSHRNASVGLLESLTEAVPAVVDSLCRRGFGSPGEARVAGAVVLTTCNRVEFYLDLGSELGPEPSLGPRPAPMLSPAESEHASAGDAPAAADPPAALQAAADSALVALAAAARIETERLRACVDIRVGRAVPAHLFAVASGLESMVVGEDEIAGQVGRALEAARAAGTTSGTLERLFQQAARTSRGVKNGTALGGAGRSLVRVALELASSRVADWSDARVLVIGTGRYAATTVDALRSFGARELRVHSPSGRAAGFAARHGLLVEPDLPAAVAASDVVIACTANAVIGPDAFAATGRVLVLDLGLPRNIDPAVGDLPGVELLDLETVRLHVPLPQFDAHLDARAMVGEAAARFDAERAAAPAIAALRRRILETVESEVARARARGAGDETEAALRHLAAVLLHDPSVRIREAAQHGRTAELRSALALLHGVNSAPPGYCAVYPPSTR